MKSLISLATDINNKIKANEDEIINILNKAESYNTATYEIKASINTLNNIDREEKYLSNTKRFTAIAAFLPQNLPLYSLILYAVVPGFVSKHIFVRAPILIKKVVRKLLKIIDPKNKKIILIDQDRHTFLEGYVKKSEAIVFTGLYENALKIFSECPWNLFIFNGYGVNPLVITRYADTSLAARKTVETRCFNSGQDCSAPDVILVDEKIAKDFISKLVRRVKSLQVGPYTDRKTDVGKLLDRNVVMKTRAFIERFSDQIICGGRVDLKSQIVYPTVIVSHSQKHKSLFEFFSPIFFVSIYKNQQNLRSFFQSEHYKDNAMYCSIFGKLDDKTFIENSIILYNETVFGADDGNKEFGGYGPKASFVIYNFKKTPKPILISGELYNYSRSQRA